MVRVCDAPKSKAQQARSCYLTSATGSASPIAWLEVKFNAGKLDFAPFLITHQLNSQQRRGAALVQRLWCKLGVRNKLLLCSAVPISGL
jgi:hypothetical protein